MTFSPNFRGIIYMVLAAVTFVTGDSFLKMMLLQVPPMQSLVLRGLSASVWCLLLLVIMGQARQLHLAFNFWILVRAGAEVAAVSSFIVALAHVPIGTITSIYQTAPLIVLLGASLFWGEKIGALRWVLIGLGLLGALLVAQPGRDGASPYALLGFLTAIGSAARDLLSRKTRADVPGLVVAFSVILAVLFISLINNQIFERWTPVAAETWLYSIGAGFFVMLGQLFVFLSFRHATARAVAPFYYTFTIVAVTLGALVFNEYPNALAGIGIAMIMACGLAVLYVERGEVQS